MDTRNLLPLTKEYSWKLFYLFCGVILIYQFTRWLYNIYLHPLSHFPGPLLWRASRVPFETSNVRGRVLKDVSVLHARYGEVVRIAPGTLSFIHPSAWPDIYAHKPGHLPFPKDPLRYTHDTYINGYPDIFDAEDRDHPRLRRLLKPVFSDKALREQEPLIQSNVDLLINKLRGQISLSTTDSSTTGVVDLNTWLNLTTFDLIGDLAFGEPFGCLDRGSYHPWVALIFASVRAVSILGAIKQFPLLYRLWQVSFGGVWMRAMRQHHQLVIEKVDKRLDRKTDRKDFMEFALYHENANAERMSTGELYSNMGLLIMAGSETSATALSGTLYHLGRNRQVLKSLQAEIRAKYSTERDITFESFAGIPNLLAALKESMRMYPSTPTYTPRIVPKGGAEVAGNRVPENTTVGLFQFIAYKSPLNFLDPQKYDPSRWLGNPVYKSDRREVFRPFSIGPKNCIGMQLAYAEMQLIIARMLWNFDIELADEKSLWTDQKVHWSWVRTPLMMRLKGPGEER